MQKNCKKDEVISWAAQNEYKLISHMKENKNQSLCSRSPMKEILTFAAEYWVNICFGVIKNWNDLNWKMILEENWWTV